MKGLAIIVAAFAASAAVRNGSSQTLEAHESGTGKQIVSHWQTYWGSYDRDYHQTKKIRVTVTDVTRRSPLAKVYVLFVARAKPASTLFVYNYAILTADFRGQIELTDEVSTPPLVLSEQHYAALGENYSQGAVAEGWLAVGRAGPHIFGTTASSQTLRDIANSRERLRDLIATADDSAKLAVLTKAESDPIPAPIATPPAPPIAPALPPPIAEPVVTITAPTEISIRYGKTTLPRGMRLKLVARQGQTVTASYMGETVAIPIAATDLK